jgi:hypothetical protein
MQITASQPNDRGMLDFIRRFESHDIQEFTFVSGIGKPDPVVVMRTMTGKDNLMSKPFNLLINMGRLIGANFEKGLVRLRLL